MRTFTPALLSRPTENVGLPTHRMKLFDANLSPKLAVVLSGIYEGCLHVMDVGLERSDSEIWDYAKANGFVIVSKDSDFQQRAMVFGHPPKVILVRLGNCKTSVVEALLRQRYEAIKVFGREDDESLLAIP